MDNPIEINLAAVDWNNLKISEFNSLEKRLQANNKLLKASKPKEPRVSGNVFVKIKGETYSIKQITYQRLSQMKSEKSKNKLIEEILSTHNPVAKL